jgi:hypothetical protein
VWKLTWEDDDACSRTMGYNILLSHIYLSGVQGSSGRQESDWRVVKRHAQSSCTATCLTLSAQWFEGVPCGHACMQPILGDVSSDISDMLLAYLLPMPIECLDADCLSAKSVSILFFVFFSL